MENRAVVIEGYLVKSPPEEKIKKNYKWHRRYFRLWSDQTLEYLKRSDDAVCLKQPLNLQLCLGLLDTDKKYEKHFQKGFKWAFCLNMKNRQYHLVAPTEMQRNQWKLAIANVCGFGSNMTRTNEEMVEIMTHGLSSLPRRVSATSNKTDSSGNSVGDGSPAGLRNLSVLTNTESLPLSASDGETKPRSSSNLSEPFTSDIRNSRSTTSSEEEEVDFLDTSILSETLGYDRLPPPVPLSTTNADGYTNINDIHDVRPTNSKPGEMQTNDGFANYDTPKALLSSSQIKEDDNDIMFSQIVNTQCHIVKQSSTKNGRRNMNSEGYMHMGLDEEGYIHVEKASSGSRETLTKQFRVFSPNQRSQSLLPNQKVNPLLPQKSLTLNSRNKLVSHSDEVIMDEIPKMPNSLVNEVKYINASRKGPPEINRQSKPIASPQVDRSTKPRIERQTSEPFDNRDDLDEQVQFDFSRSMNSSLKFASNIQNCNEIHNIHTLPFNTHTNIHSNTEHEDSQTYINNPTNIHKEDETEQNYFNSKISNRPSIKSMSSLDESMDNYDNINLLKNKPYDTTRCSNRSFRDNRESYELVKRKYENEDLPTPPFNNNILTSNFKFSTTASSAMTGSKDKYKLLKSEYQEADLPDLPISVNPNFDAGASYVNATETRFKNNSFKDKSSSEA